MPCPRCGTESQPDQRFCKNCGAALEAAGGAPSAAAAAPPPVALHAIPDGGLTLEEVVAWLQSGGYSAKVVTAEGGKRHIVSNAHGSTFNIFTPGCLSGRSTSIELLFAFSSRGKFDVSKLNEWNSNVPWCKAYYDTVNDPCLDMDISLSPGGTYESLNDQFATWNSVLGTFINKYGLR